MMITMTFAYLHQYENPFGLSPTRGEGIALT
jgi:hypothetical protein